MTNKQKIEKYLKVEENHIYADTSLTIVLDSDDFKMNDDELVDISDSEDDSTSDLVGSLNIPGILNLLTSDDSFQLYFNFDINFVIPSNFVKDKNLSTYYFEKGDLICFAKIKSSNTDIRILDKLFENRVKYLRGDLQKHVIAVYDQMLVNQNVQMHHLETLLTVLYGENSKDGFIPVRLGSQQYTKDKALSSKESAHKFNSAVGFDYGYSKDVINNNITRKYDTVKTDLEKIIGGHFDELANTKQLPIKI